MVIIINLQEDSISIEPSLNKMVTLERYPVFGQTYDSWKISETDK